MSKPKSWIANSGYGMALIAKIKIQSQSYSIRDIEARTGIKVTRLYDINNGKVTMKYMEQVLLEQMLPDETVANLRNLWCNTGQPLTFWERQLAKGTKP